MWYSPSSPRITLPPHVQFWARRSPVSCSIGARPNAEHRAPTHGERQWQRPATQDPANAQSASFVQGPGALTAVAAPTSVAPAALAPVVACTRYDNSRALPTVEQSTPSSFISRNYQPLRGSVPNSRAVRSACTIRVPCRYTIRRGARAHRVSPPIARSMNMHVNMQALENGIGAIVCTIPSTCIIN